MLLQRLLIRTPFIVSLSELFLNALSSFSSSFTVCNNFLLVNVFDSPSPFVCVTIYSKIYANAHEQRNNQFESKDSTASQFNNNNNKDNSAENGNERNHENFFLKETFKEGHSTQSVANLLWHPNTEPKMNYTL